MAFGTSRASGGLAVFVFSQWATPPAGVLQQRGGSCAMMMSCRSRLCTSRVPGYRLAAAVSSKRQGNMKLGLASRPCHTVILGTRPSKWRM